MHDRQHMIRSPGGGNDQAGEYSCYSTPVITTVEWRPLKSGPFGTWYSLTCSVWYQTTIMLV